MGSASSSDDVQPPDSLELFSLEEATEFKAEHIASACMGSMLRPSKLPLLGERDPAIIMKFKNMK